MKPKIIAVDFDGTLCENDWPNIGLPNHEIIDYLISEQSVNKTKLILWTCRTGEKLDRAVKWCEGFGLHFDAVNENLPEIIEEFGGDNRKVFANEYIDDLASTRFKLPFVPRYEIEEEKKSDISELCDIVKQVIYCNVGAMGVKETAKLLIRLDKIQKGE